MFATTSAVCRTHVDHVPAQGQGQKDQGHWWGNELHLVRHGILVVTRLSLDSFPKILFLKTSVNSVEYIYDCVLL